MAKKTTVKKEEPSVAKAIKGKERKTVKKPAVARKKTEKQEDKDGKEEYFEAKGRRKESVARVRLYTKKASDVFPEDKGLISVNQKPYQDYFKDPFLQSIVETPLRKLKSLDRFKSEVRVLGGGISGQADAIKLGLSRALTLFDVNYRKKLRKSGLLTQDSRVKERRKYGLKKARKAPQWAKR